jgi:hypothetical protein
MVTGVLERLSEFRNKSWSDVCFSAIAISNVLGGIFPAWRRFPASECRTTPARCG